MEETLLPSDEARKDITQLLNDDNDENHFAVRRHAGRLCCELISVGGLAWLRNVYKSEKNVNGVTVVL